MGVLILILYYVSGQCLCPEKCTVIKVRENRRRTQEWTIQRHWQHWTRHI